MSREDELATLIAEQATSAAGRRPDARNGRAMMPHVPDALTGEERRELKRWEDQLANLDREREEARQAFAAWVRETGLYKVAREMDVPPDRLNQRLRGYEGKRRREGPS